MRVLAITHSLGRNGAALCLYDLLCAVRQWGGSADVLYAGDEALKPKLLEQGIGIVQSAGSGDYDVALVNTLLDHGQVPEAAGLLPVVFWVHEGLTLLANQMEQASLWTRAFAASSRIVFQTAWQSSEVFRSFLANVAPRRVEIVPPAVSAPVLQAGPVPLRALHSGEASNILSVGGVYPRKRPGDLVRSVVALAAQGLNVHCTLVGSLAALQRNDASMLELLRSHAHLFTLTGEIEREQVVAQMRQADVFCCASGDESFSMAVLDAAAMGLPMALSDLPGTRDLWRHGVNALLAPVGAEDCLAWNLRALAQDRQLAARLAQAAVAAARPFSQQIFLQRMTGVLCQAIADPLAAFGP